VVPLTFGKFFGKKKHHFEFTAGIDFHNYYDNLDTTEKGWENDTYVTAFVGYRLQDPAKNFQFRVGLTPFVEFFKIEGEQYIDVFLSGGISVGHRF